jgi:hypothetical protein
MALWEVPLFPPLVRFFIAFFLIFAVAGSAALFVYWISTKYGKEE